MRKLALAITIVFALAAVSYFLLRSFLVHEDLVGSIYETQMPRAFAALWLGVVTYVHQLLVARNARPSFTALPRRVVSLDAYMLPWYVLIAYGVCFVYAVSGVGTIVVWAIGEITSIYPTQLIRFINVFIICIAFFVVSSWIGSRSNTYRFLTTLALVILYRIVATTVDLLLEPASILSTIVRISTSTPLYLTVALFGLWWGYRRRLLRYLRYLLKFVPASMRTSVVHRTYEEVQALVAGPPTLDVSTTYTGAPA